MIIVGLGNPGKQYVTTRHNAGWWVLDALAADLGLSWKNERSVDIASINGHWLVKPQSFMNESGPAVQDWLQYKKITVAPGDLLIVHDELDFPTVGTVKLQRDRSSAGHNGVQSMFDTFGTQDMWRLRIGIGDNRPLNMPAENYVLQHVAAADQPVMDQAIKQAVELLREKIV